MSKAEIDELYSMELAKIYRSTFYTSYRVLGPENETTKKAYDKWKNLVIKNIERSKRR